MTKLNRGVGRAHITHVPQLSTKSPGRRLSQLNPNFEVVNQNAPTAAHPVSQHKQFKGHSTGAKGGRVPK